MPFFRTMTGMALGALPLLLARDAFAQGEFDDAAAAGVGAGVCAMLSGIALLIPITILAVTIAMVVWVGKDAKARGMENSIVWMLLTFFASFLGLIIYILSRPKGDKVVCSNCANPRLQSLTKCPHCGAA